MKYLRAMKVQDCLTHIDNSEDRPFLKTRLLDVNIRLMTRNPAYMMLVRECCNLICRLALTKMDGYKLPHGMSGANVGIPFNIIAVVDNRGQDNAVCTMMINPRIIRCGGVVEAESNCGSVRLDAPIKVKRHAEIDVQWVTIDGHLFTKTFTRETGAFTIQHEVDHNLGILITDRASADQATYGCIAE